MNKILVIAEKPSVGKNLATVLKCKIKKNGYFEGDKYIVTWALGHLVSLAQPEAYDSHFKSWNLSDLPIIFDQPKYEILKETRKQYNCIQSLFKGQRVKSVIIATDAGREGELVARLILHKLNYKGRIQRLWISSVTDKAIKDGFNNLQPGEKYNNLYQAALARAEADWLVGINATRALTTKYNAQLSAGRVQTPTLNLINNRENEIKVFKSKEYFTYNVEVNGVNFNLLENNSLAKFTEEETLLKLDDNLKQNADVKLLDIKIKEKKVFPKELYDLTSLQREASDNYGYSPKYTLDIIQSLYEYHKIVTYPRTDSKFLTNDMISTFNERIMASNVFTSTELIRKINFSKINYSKFVDNSKVTDHHAIIPTEEKPNMHSLSNEELRIYKMIVQRFQAVFLEPFIYDTKEINLEINNKKFRSKISVVKKIGFRELQATQKTTEEEEYTEGIFDEKAKFEINDTTILSNYTQAPKPFTESLLLDAMENPQKYEKDPNQKKLIKVGIGTVATRADIIEKLFSSFLIEKEVQKLKVTPKGKQLLKIAPVGLKSALLTSQWEEKLIMIEKGKFSHHKFIEDIKKYSFKTIEEIKDSKFKFEHQNMTNEVCEKCGEKLLFVKGKKGLMLVCSNIECKDRTYLNVRSNPKCPSCHKKAQLIGDIYEKMAIVCKFCGYRENISKIKNQTVAKGANKNEIKNLLKKQKAELESKQIEDNPFANFFNKK